MAETFLERLVIYDNLLSQQIKNSYGDERKVFEYTQNRLYEKFPEILDNKNQTEEEYLA